MRKADYALQKVCRQEVIITSTFMCHTTGHNEHYYGIYKVMCIAQECMHWERDTDTVGHCKKETSHD